MMPLHHVGGIVRNLFAPVIAGGLVVCVEGAFDPDTFWNVVPLYGVTWYYASPTMHHSILQAGDARLEARDLRLVANAAGGLLPSLAERLAVAFRGAILPSYGMTECA